MRRIPTVLVIWTVLLAAPAWALFGGASKRPAPGDPAPTFTVPLLAGGEFDLTPHVGKNVILLDFWSIYCVSCVQEMPRLVEIYNKYKDKGLTAVGIDLDSFGTRRVKKFVKGLKFEVSYPIVVDKRREVAGKYAVSVLPTTVVIDRSGKVVFYHVGYSPGDENEIEEKIKAALGE